MAWQRYWLDLYACINSGSIPAPLRCALPHRCMPSKLYGLGVSSLQASLCHQGKNNRSPSDASFHYEPYELLWHPPHIPDPIHIQGKLYSSPAFFNAHKELQNSPTKPGCNLPQVVIALMFSSDLTHLTAFGNTKLWLLYLFFLAMIQSTYAVSQQVTCANMSPISSRWEVHVALIIFHHCCSFSSYKLAAPGFFQGVCLKSDGRKLHTNHCIHNTLRSGAHAPTVESSAWWWVLGSMEAWNCHPVPWWSSMMVLSANFHLFCGLSGKVSFIIR